MAGEDSRLAPPLVFSSISLRNRPGPRPGLDESIRPQFLYASLQALVPIPPLLADSTQQERPTQSAFR